MVRDATETGPRNGDLRHVRGRPLLSLGQISASFMLFRIEQDAAEFDDKLYRQEFTEKSHSRLNLQSEDA